MAFKLPDVDPQQKMKARGEGAHLKGEFVFEVQEPVEFKVNEAKEDGPSKTYLLTVKSIEAKDPDCEEGAGNSIRLVDNVSYHNGNGYQQNEGGCKELGMLLLSTGIASPGQEIDLDDPQFAARLAMELPGKIFVCIVIHKQEKRQERQEDGTYIDTDEYIARAYIAEYWAVQGGVGNSSTTPIQDNLNDDY